VQVIKNGKQSHSTGRNAQSVNISILRQIEQAGSRRMRAFAAEAAPGKAVNSPTLSPTGKNDSPAQVG